MYEKTTLPNGLRVVTSTMPATRSVTISFYVGAGSRYETDEQAGMSHLLEHLLFKGSRKYPNAQDISEGIERVGGVMNASTDREATTYWCKVARPHFGLALDILADVVRHPLLDPAEMEKECRVVIEELHMTNDEPSSRVDILLEQLLWPNNPLGRDVGGTEESVKGITRAALQDYVARQYSPANAVVSITGDITHEEVVEAVSALLGDWEPVEPLHWYPGEDSQTEFRLCLENRRTDQAHLSLAVKGLSSRHPERYALDLLSTALGEGMSSRLFLEMRERRGLAYDVHSYPVHLLDCGSLNIYCGVDPKNAARAAGTILEELNRIKDGLPDDELTKARELAKGRLLLRMEDTRAVASWIGLQELLHGQIRTVDEVVEAVDAVAPEQVQDIARRLLVTEKLNLAVVGPNRSEERFRRALQL